MDVGFVGGVAGSDLEVGGGGGWLFGLGWWVCDGGFVFVGLDGEEGEENEEREEEREKEAFGNEGC